MSPILRRQKLFLHSHIHIVLFSLRTYTNILALKSTNSSLSQEALAADLRAAKYIHDRIIHLHAPVITAVDPEPISEDLHTSYDLIQELKMEIRAYEDFLREDRLYKWADQNFEDVVDGHRRAIAGYHQALELYSQGPGCFMAAYEDMALVFQGKRCVRSLVPDASLLSTYHLPGGAHIYSH